MDILPFNGANATEALIITYSWAHKKYVADATSDEKAVSGTIATEEKFRSCNY